MSRMSAFEGASLIRARLVLETSASDTALTPGDSHAAVTRDTLRLPANAHELGARMTFIGGLETNLRQVPGRPTKHKKGRQSHRRV